WKGYLIFHREDNDMKTAIKYSKISLSFILIFSFLLILFRDSKDIVKSLFLIYIILVIEIISSKKILVHLLGKREITYIYISIIGDIVSILICFYIIKDIFDVDSALIFSLLISPVWLYPKIK